MPPPTYITFKDALKRWIEQWFDLLTPRLRHRSPPASLTIELTLRDGSKCDGPGVQATLKVHVVDAPETPLSTQSGCDKNPEVAIAKALCYLHPPEVYSPSPCLRNIDSPEAWGMFSGGGVKTQVGVHLQ